MNKWKALLAALLVVVSMTACANESEETGDSAETESVEQETPRETYAPGEDKIIMHTSVLLETEDSSNFVNGVNPYYDSATNTVAFVIDRVVSYEDEFSCDIAVTGDDLYLIKGTLVTDEYPSLCTEDGYRGAAIRLDEAIAPGTYNFNVNFSYYNVGFSVVVE